MFLILAALMMVMAANDWMLTNMVGALAFAMVVGTLLGWVGDHIPVWKTWFGGGMLFACQGSPEHLQRHYWFSGPVHSDPDYRLCALGGP